MAHRSPTLAQQNVKSFCSALFGCKRTSFYDNPWDAQASGGRLQYRINKNPKRIKIVASPTFNQRFKAKELQE